MSGRVTQFLLGAGSGVILLATLIFVLAEVFPPGGGDRPAAFARKAEVVRPASLNPVLAEAPAPTASRVGFTQHSVALPPFAIMAPSHWRRMAPAELDESYAEHSEPGFSALMGLQDGECDDCNVMLVGSTGLRDGDPLNSMATLSRTHKILSWISWVWGSPIKVLTSPHELRMNGLIGATMSVRYGGSSGTVVIYTLVDLEFDRLLVVHVLKNQKSLWDQAYQSIQSIREF